VINLLFAQRAWLVGLAWPGLAFGGRERSSRPGKNWTAIPLPFLSAPLGTGQSLLHYLFSAATYLTLLARGGRRRPRQRHRHSASSESVNSNSSASSSAASITSGTRAAFRRRGLRYFFLAAVDTQAKYLVSRAFQYTSLVGVQVSSVTRLSAEANLPRPPLHSYAKRKAIKRTVSFHALLRLGDR